MIDLNCIGHCCHLTLTYPKFHPKEHFFQVLRAKQGETGRTGCQESLEKKGKREPASLEPRGSLETLGPRVSLATTVFLEWTGSLACKGTREIEDCQGKRWAVLKICLSVEYIKYHNVHHLL